MDINIAEKLFPNLLTFLAQLASTGILFLAYRKFLHEPVMRYLNGKANELQEAEIFAQEVEAKAQAQEEELAKERIAMREEMANVKDRLLKEANLERDALLEETQQERQRIILQTEQLVEQKKEEMLREVEQHAVELAAAMTEKVLMGYHYDEQQTLRALQEEMSRLNETN